jgi:hypothetical protein
MTEPGPAQLDLIRRYARTLREMHADAMAARGPRIGAREARRVAASKPPRGHGARAMAPGAGAADPQQRPPAAR